MEIDSGIVVVQFLPSPDRRDDRAVIAVNVTFETVLAIRRVAQRRGVEVYKLFVDAIQAIVDSEAIE